MIPIMTVSYLILCGIILFKFSENILPSLKLITGSFFTTSSFNSGLSLGLILEMLTIIQVGTLRGIFATDIGLGSKESCTLQLFLRKIIINLLLNRA